ncbi:MerR family transcriptional regulator [Gracilibacillus caseinilyticus]|uniref:MerR family transcriptional regulator n=1 Tax=Gracilibacillus caseinilyticus TaxID=2932256 RepID=A0ABY4EZT4_9BACI|nr:MerR family transcriptional regulator [Gracilibacillus caseinilyticus]UOQ49783.1 MerR family transcriptional regulator [Gracilibacillus caseinilyticus]
MKYNISALSNLLNVSTNTIRRYEKLGYLTPERSRNNYRYYSDPDIQKFMNVRLLRKYGFTHTEIGSMKSNELSGLITAFETRLETIDEEINYLTNLRHRIKDDFVLMKKADASKQPFYIRDCVAFSYVLYQRGEQILKEPERLMTVQDYLHLSPEVQRIYLIRKEDVEKDHIILNAGWAIKMSDLDRFKIKDRAYTERYEKRKSLLSVVKLPVNMKKTGKSLNVKESLLKEPFQYMKEQNLTITGDIIGVVIANVLEEDQEMQYILVGIPIALM